jgi:hypothetical protein
MITINAPQAPAHQPCHDIQTRQRMAQFSLVHDQKKEMFCQRIAATIGGIITFSTVEVLRAWSHQRNAKRVVAGFSRRLQPLRGSPHPILNAVANSFTPSYDRA